MVLAAYRADRGVASARHGARVGQRRPRGSCPDRARRSRRRIHAGPDSGGERIGGRSPQGGGPGDCPFGDSAGGFRNGSGRPRRADDDFAMAPDRVAVEALSRFATKLDPARRRARSAARRQPSFRRRVVDVSARVGQLYRSRGCTPGPSLDRRLPRSMVGLRALALGSTEPLDHQWNHETSPVRCRSDHHECRGVRGIFEARDRSRRRLYQERVRSGRPVS